MKIHFVKKGDTLYEIGKKYGVTAEELVAANPSVIDPDQIEAGMKLIVPQKNNLPSSQNDPQFTQNEAMGNNPLVSMVMPQTPVYPQSAMQQLKFDSPIKEAPLFGESIPPFAAIPIPAQKVSSYGAMPPTPEWGAPQWYNQQPAEWAINPKFGAGYPMPNKLPMNGYDTPYNTPFNTNNYMAPVSFNHPQFYATQAAPAYQSYPMGMMQPASFGAYEFYSIYSAPQDIPPGSPQNLQPMGDLPLPYEDTSPMDTVIEENQRELLEKQNKKAQTSSNDKAVGAAKRKKTTLHDQLAKMNKNGRNADSRERRPSANRSWANHE